jgi:hypothetical protein
VSEAFTIHDDVTFERLCNSAIRKAARGELPVGKTINLYKSADAFDQKTGKRHVGLVEIAVTVRIVRELK